MAGSQGRCAIGLAIAGGNGLQTWGMQTISSSQSAFLTALYVPVVPLLQWLFLRRPPGIIAWAGILLLSAMGLGAASALIQVTMNWPQRSVSPTRATVIYAGEPVWAGVVGRIAGERLPTAALLDGVLIVGGVIVSELRIQSAREIAQASVPR